jgi:hypothetical protein
MQAITGSSDMHIVRCVHTPASPISHPQECPDAFAGIGLVVDGVGPRKPKTSESQQPRPAIGPLLGVVRGVRGVEGVLSGGGTIIRSGGEREGGA